MQSTTGVTVRPRVSAAEYPVRGECPHLETSRSSPDASRHHPKSALIVPLEVT